MDIMALETRIKTKNVHLAKEQRALLNTEDVFKVLSHDDLMRRAEQVSKHILHKNRKAYEALAYR